MTNQQFIDKLKSQTQLRRQGTTLPIAWRLEQLNAFKQFLTQEKPALVEALYNDLHKSPFESVVTEINFLIDEIEHTEKHLSDWMKDVEVDVPEQLQPSSAYIRHEPLGTILIMGAWNYPLNLTLAPLVPAIAAGNCAVIKPPRTAAATSRAIRELLPKYLDNTAFFVTEEDTSNDFLLDQAWDKIFVTGSGKVGKIVMQAAAKRLIPVTLELGGKSPAFIDKSSNLEKSVKRILRGKFMNAGQTCVAPDYVLIDKSIADEFYSLVPKVLKEFFGEDPFNSKDYARIINERAWDGLVKLWEGQDILVGGQSDRAEKYIAPTVLKNVSLDAEVMQDEIFGPILPVIEVNSMDEGIDIVVDRDKPLALYVFAEDQNVADHIIRNTSAGDSCINECLFQLGVPDLPFGGVGASGMGKYHGKHGFLDLSNARGVLKRPTDRDSIIGFPPFPA